MEQLKQILQLNADRISIREIGRRLGISRNSVRKYLTLLSENSEANDNKKLADKAYNNQQIDSKCISYRIKRRIFKKKKNKSLSITICNIIHL